MPQTRGRTVIYIVVISPQKTPKMMQTTVCRRAGVLNRDNQLGVVKELTEIVAAAAGNPTLAERIWVLVVESPDGGWGIAGHANTNAFTIRGP